MNNNKNMFVGGTHQSDYFTPCSDNGFDPTDHVMNNSRTMIDKIQVIEESNKLSDDIDFDPNINEDDDGENEGKSRKRTGKRHQSKNLEAERKRRKKLNDRLYTLRSLVPNISKLDRAAILGDAINYIKELEQQVQNLQFELQQDSDIHENNDMITIPETKCGPQIGYERRVVGKTNNEEHQMEPQVEVFEMNGNELLVKVFCEYKAGGFVRQIEVLTSLGFKVTDVNTTRHTCLVSNIFRVEKRGSGTIQADHVKESLLRVARFSL